MDLENGTSMHNGILLNHKSEFMVFVTSQINLKSYVTLNKPDTEEQIPYNISHT